MNTIAQLITFIEAHGFEARSTEDGKIVGLMIYCKDGKAYGEWETIEPTAKAVRNWLGY